MLSALSLVSYPFFVSMWIISVLPSSTPFVLTQPLPRLRPTLGAWAAVVVILALDFTAVAICSPPIRVSAELCLWDGVLTLAVIVSATTARRSTLKLWEVAIGVAMLGYLIVIVVATRSVIAIR